MIDNSYVKWKTFTYILAGVFFCIATLFTLYGGLKTESYANQLNYKDDLSEIKEQLHELQWLNDLKPKNDNTVGINIYEQVEDKIKEREDFIDKIKQLTKN